jgi:CRISPR-associated endonuclease/helicase Cas3
MGTMSFDEYFARATGLREPYEYQRALAAADPPPAVLDVPTGSGKTQALLAAWLYRRRQLRRGPRRLVYALPMRTLVEQTSGVARDMRRRLGIDQDELRIHVLMGGQVPSEDDWRRFPTDDQIIVGTIDMLLSRALNRGYGESRFAWPVSFGLLNADARWVFDEVQLMGPARTTSAQLDGLRAKLGVARSCETIWVSATIDDQALRTIDRPELGASLELSDADRQGDLARRLNADKRVERVDLTSMRPAGIARAIATAVLDRHRPGTRSIVVLNRVDLAQQVTGALDRLATDVEIVPLHSRYRPPERSIQVEHALAAVNADCPGRIVVSTQVIEAGVDTTSTLLATESAPFSSIVQRLGRCNRAGEDKEATVLWLDRGDLDARQAAPYDPRDIATARIALEALVGRDASPAVFETLDVEEQSETWSVLRRRHLLDLFDTSPDLSGLDVDVARFIRPDDERTVSVFFRTGPRYDADPAERDELVDVPIGSLGERRRWVNDHVDGLWRPPREPLRPGATVMLNAAQGGYDARLGWLPASRTEVTPVGPTQDRRADAIDTDPDSATATWMELTDHLTRARSAAVDLTRHTGTLDAPAAAADAIVAAAALHDVGKAHEIFQERLLATIDDGDDDELEQRRDTTWAKSARRSRGRPHDGHHFRHELASVVALLNLDGDAPLPSEARDLTLYLIAAHHGKVRLVVRSAPEEQPPPEVPRESRTVLGVVDREILPAVRTPMRTLPSVSLELSVLDVIPSWTERCCALRDDPTLGPFRLGFLEALVRIADWRASA